MQIGTDSLTVTVTFLNTKSVVCDSVEDYTVPSFRLFRSEVHTHTPKHPATYLLRHIMTVMTNSSQHRRCGTT